MADRGRVKLREAEIQSLIGLYHKAYKELTETIITSTEAGRIQKAKVLATIKVTLRGLGDDVDKWASKNIPQYYLDGANVAIQDLRDLGVDVQKASGLAVVNKTAIEALIGETRGALFESITGIQRNISNIINESIRQQTNFIIADGKLKGDALRTISSSVKQKIKDGRIAALTDSRGRKWSFDTYANMLVRTKSVEARNQGLSNRMLQNGYDLVQISNHGSKHPACAKWEGQILSLTGNTPGYPTLYEATIAGLFHPNCQHAANVINPEIAKLTNAYDNPYNYDKASASKKEFKSAPSGKVQNIQVFHGGGGGVDTRGTNLFGNAFYVSRDQKIAKKFGNKITESTLSIAPSKILKVNNDAEHNKLVLDAIKKYPFIDPQDAIPKYAKDLGYKAIEASPDLDPLGGIAVLDESLLK